MSMVGKAQPNTEYYHRIDTALYKDLSPKVKYLSTLSCGLAIGFKTNSRLLQLTGKLNRTSPHKTYRTLPIAD